MEWIRVCSLGVGHLEVWKFHEADGLVELLPGALTTHPLVRGQPPVVHGDQVVGRVQAGMGTLLCQPRRHRSGAGRNVMGTVLREICRTVRLALATWHHTLRLCVIAVVMCLIYLAAFHEW